MNETLTTTLISFISFDFTLRKCFAWKYQMYTFIIANEYVMKLSINDYRIIFIDSTYDLDSNNPK